MGVRMRMRACRVWGFSADGEGPQAGICRDPAWVGMAEWQRRVRRKECNREGQGRLRMRDARPTYRTWSKT